MSIETVLTELKHERARLDRAIEALEQLDSRLPAAKAARTRQPAGPVPKHGHLTEAGRKRISELSKQRWAEWRKNQGAGTAKSGKGTSSTDKTKSGKPSRGSRS